MTSTFNTTDAYLDLLIRRVTAIDFDIELLSHLESSLGRRLKPNSAPLLDRLRYRIAELVSPDGFRVGKLVDATERQEGEDYPQKGLSMVGEKRLRHLIDLIKSVVDERVPGDIIETGVWRGGAALAAKGALMALGDTKRKLILADSFEGLPKPGITHHTKDALNLSDIDYLSVSEDEVRETFSRFGLLDEGVEFLKGWFHETLPTLRDREFSLLRLDGDLYSSTMVALEELYPRLSLQGYVVIDDWQIDECREAVEDFRNKMGVDEEITDIDGYSVFWRKQNAVDSP